MRLVAEFTSEVAHPHPVMRGVIRLGEEHGIQMESWSPPSGSPQSVAIAFVRDQSDGSQMDASFRVTLNFHPDRGDTPVLKHLVDGCYRSQFETGTSNGALTAHAGGERWHWESRLFGCAYDLAAPVDRPKYGALNDRNSPFGGSPRFGSSHIRLVPSVLSRCTFCYPDSYYKPKYFAVFDRMSLVSHLNRDRDGCARDPLDLYIEAHIHGPIELSTDVEAVVLDPSFHDTEIETISKSLPCPVEWHQGLELTADRLEQHADYRSAESFSLGLKLSRNGPLNARRLAEAARRRTYDPGMLKHLWHHVACFGQPPLAHR